MAAAEAHASKLCACVAAARAARGRARRAFGRLSAGACRRWLGWKPPSTLPSLTSLISFSHLSLYQAKQLPEHDRLAFARLILAMQPSYARCDRAAVAAALGDLGIVFSKRDNTLANQIARGMFDTISLTAEGKKFKVDPFAEDSPIRQVSITTFPPDIFFILRVTQMLRGLAGGMGVDSFSNVQQWAPYAAAAVRGGARLRGGVAPDSEVALPAERGVEEVVMESGDVGVAGTLLPALKVVESPLQLPRRGAHLLASVVLG